MSQKRHRNPRGAAFAAAAVFFLFCGTACVTSPPGDASPTLELRPQSGAEDQCGPTTLSSVFAFYGVDVPEEKISAEIHSPTARGVLITDLARFAREQGFEARLATGGTSADLADWIDRGVPPVVLLDMGVGNTRAPHFTAVIGVTEGGVFLIGESEPPLYYTNRKFERLWTRAGNQYLLLFPSSADASSL